MRAPLHALFGVVLVSLLLAGCKGNPQRDAFAEAEAMERANDAVKSSQVIAAYEKAASLDSSSDLGLRAREKVVELQAKANRAEEQHKAVFQEHGVD